MSDFSPGDRVWWHERGPEDHWKFAAVVREAAGGLVEIGIAGIWSTSIRQVKTADLSPRSELCEFLGEKEEANV